MSWIPDGPVGKDIRDARVLVCVRHDQSGLLPDYLTQLGWIAKV